jgi:hypothetical protein
MFGWKGAPVQRRATDADAGADERSDGGVNVRAAIGTKWEWSVAHAGEIATAWG